METDISLPHLDVRACEKTCPDCHGAGLALWMAKDDGDLSAVTCFETKSAGKERITSLYDRKVVTNGERDKLLVSIEKSDLPQ